MPSNYKGVGTNVAGAPVFILSEPVDGEGGNASSVDTPLQSVADQIEYMMQLREFGQLGPLIDRSTPSGFVSVGAGFGHSSGLAFESAFGGNGLGRFVLVGNNGAGTPVIQTSDDGGLTWVARTSNAGSNNLNCVYWNGALFVAGGAAGQIVTSPDGITWTARTSHVATTINSIAYSPALGLWLAAGQNANFATSPDGTTWTAQTTGLSASGTVSATWGAGPGLFVVSANTILSANMMATSPDGVTWTVRNAPDADAVAVGYLPLATPLYVLSTGNSTGKIWTSPDGINWTLRSSTSPLTGGNWTWTGRLAILTDSGNTGRCSASRDGINWFPRPTPNGGAINGVQWALGGIVCASFAADVQASPAFPAP